MITFVFPVIQESETKNFWIFKDIFKGKTYDIAKGQLALAFRQLENWQARNGDDFSTKLFDLITKADSQNFRKIFNGFPARTTAYILWYFAADKEALYKKYAEGGNDGNQL